MFLLKVVLELLSGLPSTFNLICVPVFVNPDKRISFLVFPSPIPPNKKVCKTLLLVSKATTLGQE